MNLKNKKLNLDTNSKILVRVFLEDANKKVSSRLIFNIYHTIKK